MSKNFFTASISLPPYLNQSSLEASALDTAAADLPSVIFAIPPCELSDVCVCVNDEGEVIFIC